MTVSDSKTVCVSEINGNDLSKMLRGGFFNLSHNKDYLNHMNVFPVSDSDTGTNMKNTFEKGIAALRDGDSFNGVFFAFVSGMLIGSRGNSGAILSQYFLGLYEYTKDKNAVTLGVLCGALQHAYRLAYNAVSHPAEGTMLTVMREGITRTLPRVRADMPIGAFFDILTDEMFVSTRETVGKMDVLRENNVVDSGALGFYLIFDGMRRTFHEESQAFDCEKSVLLPKRIGGYIKNVSFFGYCTEFVLKIHKECDKQDFVPLLNNRGDSTVIVRDRDILKVHIHTNEPQKILDDFSEYGIMVSKKIDNLFLTEEFEQLRRRRYDGFAVVAFADNQKSATLLEQVGVDVAFSVPRGHTTSEDELQMLMEFFMNEKVIVLPTDKDILEKCKRIKWNFNLQNMYVVESESLFRTFFIMSSVLLGDDYATVEKSLERLKRQKVFATDITFRVTDRCIEYSGFRKKKLITAPTLKLLLASIADNDIMSRYSTVFAFGGMRADSDDVQSMVEYFEDDSDMEFTYFDVLQDPGAFMLGAF